MPEASRGGRRPQGSGGRPVRAAGGLRGRTGTDRTGTERRHLLISVGTAPGAIAGIARHARGLAVPGIRDCRPAPEGSRRAMAGFQVPVTLGSLRRSGPGPGIEGCRARRGWGLRSPCQEGGARREAASPVSGTIPASGPQGTAAGRQGTAAGAAGARQGIAVAEAHVHPRPGEAPAGREGGKGRAEAPLPRLRPTFHTGRPGGKPLRCPGRACVSGTGRPRPQPRRHPGGACGRPRGSTRRRARPNAAAAPAASSSPMGATVPWNAAGPGHVPRNPEPTWQNRGARTLRMPRVASGPNEAAGSRPSPPQRRRPIRCRRGCRPGVWLSSGPRRSCRRAGRDSGERELPRRPASRRLPRGRTVAAGLLGRGGHVRRPNPRGLGGMGTALRHRSGPEPGARNRLGGKAS
jgi:hypothetical protein